jgi:hypothetical protein
MPPGFPREAHAQVLLDGEPAEDLAALRHVADAAAHALVRRVVRDVAALQADRSRLHRHDAHQGLQQRRLADAVAPEDDRDLADLRVEADVAQDVRAAVVLVDLIDLQHRYRPK